MTKGAELHDTQGEIDTPIRLREAGVPISPDRQELR